MNSVKRALLRSLESLPYLLFALAMAVCACAPKCSESTLSAGPEKQPSTDEVALSSLVACVDGNRALAHVTHIVGFGPRHAGTDGLEKTRGYIEGQLAREGLTPLRHPFTAHTPHPQIGSVALANISVTVPGTTASPKRIILSGHFDGKLLDGAVFLGANDGGSSTGVLLEMARCLKENPPQMPVQIVFFDGEEALVDWTDSDSLYGSKNFAALLAASGDHKRIAAMVNIDMVGDVNLRFNDERNSTPWVFDALRASAGALGRPDLFLGTPLHIGDDHQPFLQLGISAANLIDLTYGPGWNSNAYWHTADDSLANISADSLQISGRIVLHALPALAKELE